MYRLDLEMYKVGLDQLEITLMIVAHGWLTSCLASAGASHEGLNLCMNIGAAACNQRACRPVSLPV